MVVLCLRPCKGDQVRVRLHKSVVTRLVACLIVGGLLVSAGLGVLELSRSEAMLRLQLAQRVSLTSRNLQSLLRGVLGARLSDQLRDSLRVVASDSYILGVRVTGEGIEPLQIGDWEPAEVEQPAIRLLPEYGMSFDGEVDWERMTIVRAPFLHEGNTASLELLIDGARAWRHTRSEVFGELRSQWFFLGVMTLLGLLLLRRWFTGPLSDVSDLVGAGAGPESFYNLSRQLPGEFGQLTEAIGGMLTRLECTTQRLRQREAAFENLYQFAPAAMLSMQVDGTIVEANRRAATLLGVTLEQDLVGRKAMDFIAPDDHGLFRQTVDRLDLDNAARCEMRIIVRKRPIDALVECTAVRDEDGTLRRVRLSMLDISQSKRLQRQLADKSQLLNLIIDHMSDAILLVDAEGRIAAHNQQLATLLHRRSESIAGELYDPEHFWNELGVVDHEVFVSRLRQIAAEDERPANQRVVTRVGTFQFQGIPVRDAGGLAVGRLWVVQEITAQEQNEKLLRHQSHQLGALKRLGQELRDVRNIDQLLHTTAEVVFDMIGVEAVGVALRRHRGQSRSHQVLNRGAGSYPLAVNRALVEAVEKHLMPRILSNQDVSYWPDLPRNEPWVAAFEQTGLSCVAGGPLRGSADGQGILWIARRGGERLERHHIYLLEALVPVIAARIEFAQQREHMRQIELTDPVTDLPNRQQLNLTIDQLGKRPGYPWSLLLVSIDRFQELNTRLGHEAGDALLRRIASALRASVRKSCDVARPGGKFFAVLAPDIIDGAAVALAERVREVIAAIPVQLIDGSPWSLTASIGVVTHPSEGTGADDLVSLAEARVEAAKRAGRNCVVAGPRFPHRQAG
jgi:diguanylate cyclase (GGDEF)-like protein/PAS domain S-box-containing protein